MHTLRWRGTSCMACSPHLEQLWLGSGRRNQCILREQEQLALTEVRVAQDMATLGDPKRDGGRASVCGREGEMADRTADKVPEVKVWLLSGCRVLVCRLHRRSCQDAARRVTCHDFSLKLNWATRWHPSPQTNVPASPPHFDVWLGHKVHHRQLSQFPSSPARALLFPQRQSRDRRLRGGKGRQPFDHRWLEQTSQVAKVVVQYRLAQKEWRSK